MGGAGEGDVMSAGGGGKGFALAILRTPCAQQCRAPVSPRGSARRCDVVLRAVPDAAAPAGRAGSGRPGSRPCGR